MTRDAILGTLKDIVARFNELPELEGVRSGSQYFEDPESIREDMPLGELGMDSLGLTAVAVEAEKAFGIELSPVLMFEVRTIGDLVSKIEAQLAEERAP